MKNLFLFAILAGCFISTPSRAVDLTNNFNFEGVLVDGSNVPITVSTLVKFQIYDPSASCLIFEETQASITPDATGFFSTKIGIGARASPAVDGGALLKNIFSNDAPPRTVGTNCGTLYTPVAYDGRKLRVTVAGNVLTPDFQMSAIPMATVAESLQGKVVSDFVLSAVAPGGDLGGTYAAPTISKIQGSAVSVAAPGAGQVLQWNGSAWTPTTPAVGGAAAGDLTGFYPGPTVSKIQGTPVSVTAPAFNQVLTYNGTNWAPMPGSPDPSKLPIAGGAMTGQINMAANRITSLGAPVAATDAATKTYVDTSVLNPNYLLVAGGLMTGPITMPVGGSAAAPVLAFNGTSAGMWQPGFNSLAIATGGAQRIMIDSTGKVGIGAAVPSATLDVNGHVANSGAVAGVGACGTGPSVAGNDTRGTVTVGSPAPASTCLITFSAPYATTPYCVVTPYGTSPGITTIWLTATTLNLTINFSGTPPVGQKYNWFCMQ